MNPIIGGGFRPVYTQQIVVSARIVDHIDAPVGTDIYGNPTVLLGNIQYPLHFINGRNAIAINPHQILQGLGFQLNPNTIATAYLVNGVYYVFIGPAPQPIAPRPVVVINHLPGPGPVVVQRQYQVVNQVPFPRGYQGAPMDNPRDRIVQPQPQMQVGRDPNTGELKTRIRRK